MPTNDEDVKEETCDVRSQQSEDSIDYASNGEEDKDGNETEDGDDDDDDDDESMNHNPAGVSTDTGVVGEDIAWKDITKRDRPLSASLAAAVTAEVERVLINRFENAEDGNFRDVKLKRFEDRLARFPKIEINIGRRIASGNFADIYCVDSWGDDVSTTTTTTATTTMLTSTAVIKGQNPPESVAVKLLRSNLLLTPKLYSTAASDLITEGTLLASLAEHPNIVTVLGRSVESVSGFASGRRDSVFLVLERLECDMTVRLREWRERAAYKNNRLIHYGISGRRDNRAALLRERLTRMLELASAMAYIHRHNVIHRYVSILTNDQLDCLINYLCVLIEEACN